MAFPNEQLDVPAETRAGYVALLGLPNAGKSSLLNRLLEQKLSIVTPFPQTTRERVIGIDTHDGVQMIFLDTPGLVDAKYLLHRSMVQVVLNAVSEADVVLLLADPTQPPISADSEIWPLLRSRRERTVVAINKTDVATAEQVSAARSWAGDLAAVEVLEISALAGTGIDRLRSTVAELLPVSPYLYPPDEISSQPVRFFVAELIREAVFERFRDEIPYSVAAKVEEFREASVPLYIRATIFVERASQKGILIGRGGAAIRELGQAAREKIESFLVAPVYLDLWIKVLPRWRRDAQALRRLGYPVPPPEN